MKAVGISGDETKNAFLFSLLEREEAQFIDPPTTTNPYAFTQARQQIIFVANKNYDRAIRIVADFLAQQEQE